MKKSLLIFMLASALLSAEDAKPLVVGTTSGYAPYVSLTPNGEYEGFDIDLAKELAKRLERPLELRDLGSMPSLMLALKQEKIDALIWAVSITEERTKKMAMVYYQGDREESMPALFWNKTPEGIASFEELATKAVKGVAIEAGSYQEEALKGFPEVKIKYTEKMMDAIMEIKYGKATAALVDPCLIPNLTARFPQLKVVDLALPPKEQSQGNGICLNLSQQELIRQVKKAVEEMQKDGTIASLEKKWKLVSEGGGSNG